RRHSSPTIFPYTTLFRSTDASLALTWNLVEIAENVVRFHDLFGREWSVEDEDAWADISEYVDADRFRWTAGARGSVEYPDAEVEDRKSTRLNSSHVKISY